MPRLIAILALSTALAAGALKAADYNSSGFGKIAIPSPSRPTSAEQCVEPVEVMRRNHMKFLDHQRDATVIDGERDGKYSLAGCMDCHNPADSSEVIRYQDPQHFCTGCHAYASVNIDCFECHSDRGLETGQQSSLVPGRQPGPNLTAGTLRMRVAHDE